MTVERQIACAIGASILGGTAVLALAMPGPAAANTRDRTSVILQVDVPGRANANRHRLSVMSRTPDGRDVMLALSCRVSEPNVLGAVIELGGKEQPPIDGRNATFRLQKPDGEIRHRLASNDEYLVLGGDPAVKLFSRVLRSEVVEVDDGAGLTARFRLEANRARIDRFRELCELE